MKKFTLFILAICVIFVAEAQLTIKSGAYLIVQTGSTVIAMDGISATDGIIDNDGTIQNQGDLINNTSTLFDSGSTGTFIFNGSSLQEITGDNDVGFYGAVEIDNASGVSITNNATGADQTINGSLALTNGMLSLNEFDLSLGATDPTGITATKYIKTNGTGSVSRNVPADGTTDIVFPVGNTNYNPLILQNGATATADDYSVRVIDNEPANSSTQHLVDRSWEVLEATPTGSELTVTPQWNGSQELTAFNRANCGVGRTTDAGVTYEWKDFDAAAGSDPYTRAGLSFTSVGTFAVADYYFSIPDNLTVSNTSIGNTEIECFDAKQVITVAGDETTVVIASGGEGVFVAGQTVYFKYGFHAYEGSYMHGYITTTDQFCGSQPSPIVAHSGESEKLLDAHSFYVPDTEGLDIHIYPNPTAGHFNIDFINFDGSADVYVMNFQGQPVFKTTSQNQLTMSININNLPNGIYLIVIKSNNQIITKRVIKS